MDTIRVVRITLHTTRAIVSFKLHYGGHKYPTNFTTITSTSTY